MRRFTASSCRRYCRAIAARSLSSGEGKSLTRRSSSCLASARQPTSIKNRTTRSRSSTLFCSTRPRTCITDSRGTWLISTWPTQKPSTPRNRAMCGPISMIACSIRIGLFGLAIVLE